MIGLTLLAFSAWNAAKLAAALAAAAFAFFLVQFAHLSAVVAWGDRKTRGLAYYGRPLAERSRFKRSLRRHRAVLGPTIWLLSRVSPLRFSRVSFSYQGVAGPKGTCSPESFRRAAEYQPRPHDVFVATQMKCGTTWMQHVVYQVLTCGSGDLAETGTALYAVSPWIESLKSVSVRDAPLVGQARPSRIIKTHLPAQLCPDSAEAKYIYVARHPLSCFASCADFIATSLGAFTVHLDEIEAWFRSEELMWWGTWPSHARGWWSRSRRRGNVLFVTFEAMKRDLPGVVRRVAALVEIGDLGQEEIGRIVRKCSFDYMHQHADAFEMNPPHVLQSGAPLFVSGRADRHKDVPPEVRRRLAAWCGSAMAGSDFPLERYYPDIAEAGRSGRGCLR